MIIKKKLQKKSKHRNKLEQEISIKETECEVLRYVLAQKPKEPIRKLVKSEMKKCSNYVVLLGDKKLIANTRLANNLLTKIV